MSIRQAVSAVLALDGRVWIARRQTHLAAFPGYQSFPGGKVDKQDGDQSFGSPLLDQHPAHHMRALARELQEELGFDLEAAIQAGQVQAIHALAHATSPSFYPVRFKNHFYRIDLKTKPQFSLDRQEIASFEAFQPGQWLQAFQAGTMLAVPPMVSLMQALADNPNATSVQDIDLVQEDVIVGFESLSGVVLFPVPSITLPPADRTNAFLIDDLLVDPSPKDEETYDQLVLALEKRATRGQSQAKRILLTHHHPDHCQYANRLARHLKAPILMSTATQNRLEASRGPKYFNGYPVQLVEEGQVVTTWQGRPVRVFAIPGHADGQIGLAPDDMSFFLVGDLIQGIGSVVISEPEGHMATYFKTLQRVIALKPKVLLPSHGAPIGGTHHLAAVLKHRQMREQQILGFLQQKMSPSDIRKQLYPNLSPDLYRLAYANIQTHSVKLREEGKLN